MKGCFKSPAKYLTLQANNPHGTNSNGKGTITKVMPTDQNARKLLNVTQANNPYRLNAKGSFGKVNPKSPDKTVASTYIKSGFVR